MHVYEAHTPETLSNWLGYLSHGEIALLRQLAQAIPAEAPTVINIGAGGGTSGLTFLAARDDVRLVTIDVVREINPLGGLENEAGILAAADPYNWQGRREGIHAPSAEVGATWTRGAVDLVFIDGDHTYLGCRADIDVWLPHLPPGGVMVLHDYRKLDAYLAQYPTPEWEITPDFQARVVKPYPGVDQAVAELLASGAVEHVATVDTLIAVRKVGG